MTIEKETVFNPGYYQTVELLDMGFKSIGKNVQIAKNCTIVGLKNISIGNNVRIDGYSSIIAAGDTYITLGSWIHVGGWSFMAAGAGVTIEDFCNLSQGVRIYTRSDDYSGDFLTNPLVPAKYTGIIQGPVHLHRHVIVGSGSVILPGVSIGKGSAVGALSLVSRSLDDWGIYCGIPVKKIKDRSKKLLELEKQLLEDL